MTDLISNKLQGRDCRTGQVANAKSQYGDGFFTSDGIRSHGIGDVNSDAKGSGARFNAGKVDLSLIPLSTLEDEARVWMYGEKKYKRFNWMKGMKWSVPLACAMRHLAAYQGGEDNDPESGLPHLAHVMCNIRMLTLYSKTFTEGDDRPKEWLGGAK